MKNLILNVLVGLNLDFLQLFGFKSFQAGNLGKHCDKVCHWMPLFPTGGVTPTLNGHTPCSHPLHTAHTLFTPTLHTHPVRTHSTLHTPCSHPHSTLHTPCSHPHNTHPVHTHTALGAPMRTHPVNTTLHMQLVMDICCADDQVVETLQV